MELSFSQTPSRVWWALEASATSHSLQLDDLRAPSASPLYTSGSEVHGNELGVGNYVFYDYVDETDHKESNEELAKWLRQHRNRGIIRVYQPGSSYYELIKCDVETTAETIMAKCLAKELYVHYGCKKVRKVRFDEHPLQLQHHFLQELGHSNIYRMQLEGLHEGLSTLIQFVAGQEKGDRPEDKVQLACALKVKEVNGSLIPFWNKRFCVLCGSRMFIFASVKPKGRPTLVVDFKGAAVGEYKSKKYMFCLKITTGRHIVCLAFESRLDQSKWLERAEHILSKHPLEANLAGYSLERVPKYYFLNYNIVGMNLAHNFMIESFSHTDAAILGQSRTIGWIEDLPIFHHLVSLSLSDNGLDQFPISLCNLVTLQELDISCNSIKNLPAEIRVLTKLTTLLLHSNELSDLPHELSELGQLATLVLAFNRFFDFPKSVMKMPVLKIFIASGNYISRVPEEINQMNMLQHLDIRFNKVKGHLPTAALSLRSLLRLNIRGNKITEMNTSHIPLLETLNCSEAALRSLVLPEGPLKSLIAKSNQITHFSIPRSCDQLTSIDLSKNELTSLPESLALLANLQKLNASDNKLTQLPLKIFKMSQLEVLKLSRNRLVTLPEDIPPNCPLKRLDIHSNQISSLPTHLLTSCTKCEMINLSSNQLHSLPSSQDHCALMELYAASNCLKDSCFTTISRYKQLKVLHLAYNSLRTIPAGSFSNFTKLECLNLAGNSLSALPPILKSPHLQCLILHSNQLHVLPALPLFRKLHTLDLSCNQLEKIPLLNSFPYLKFLDVSGNSSLVVDEDCAKIIRSSEVTHCCMEGILDVKEISTSDSCYVESGGTTTHGKWSYGSATITGIHCDVNCTSQLKSATIPSHTRGGLFAVMDGGRSPKVPQALREILEDTILAELAMDEPDEEENMTDLDPLRYLSQAFLTLHRNLGELGQKDGSSLILCHIQEVYDQTYTLNVASTGLGVAILCRSGRAVPLTTPHSPSSNAKEMMRIADARGFVSQDNRVNGVCGSSRLLGVYHLWPQVIPVPSTEAVELRKEDEYVIIGTDGLWKYVSYEQIVHEATSISDPNQVAKRLRDIAVAHGCHEDVSVVVIKLNIDRDPPIHPTTSAVQQKLASYVEKKEEEEEEEEDLGITNIDDALSDIEEEAELGGSTVPIIALPMESVNPQEDIDRMVLSAITTTNGHGMNLQSHEEPVMQSTNFDDLPLSDDLPDSPSPLATDSTPSQLDAGVHETHISHHKHGHQQDQQQLAMMTPAEYEAQTLPKITPSSRRSSGLVDFETSFEQTQSVPILQAKQIQKVKAGVSDPVDSQLLALNKALTQLGAEHTLPTGRPMSYHVESIERPRKRHGVKNGRNRLSYVEHSYNQLTNDMYSANSAGLMHHAKDIQT